MKILNIKGLIVISLLSILLFIIYSKLIKQNQLLVEENLEINEEDFSNSNLIKDIKYSSKDLKGNEYTITADEGEIDLGLQKDYVFILEKFVNKLNNESRQVLLIDVANQLKKYNPHIYKYSEVREGR